MNIGVVTRLTRRECECVYWVGFGYSNRDIATLMGCGCETVKVHIQRIFNKTGLSTRLEVFAWAWAKGYVAF